MKTFSFFSLIVLLLITSNELFSQQTPVVTLPNDLQIVLNNYETHWKNNDAEALAMLFTENGFILRPGHSPTRGRKNIEEAYNSSGGDLVLKAYDFQINGELAFIIGGYTYGTRTDDVGKFTLVLKKVTDKWLIHSDMDNGNN